MLEEQDFKKLGEVIREEIKGPDFRNVIREEIGKSLEQIVLPRFEMLEKRITKIETEMVTKSYLDDKLADLEGIIIARQRKEDKKVNLLIEFLQKKNILQENEIKMLKDFRIFPDLNLN